MRKILGILGGMGPLTSAEFLKTIYEYNIHEQEQDAPACIVYSDPSFPDRTEAVLGGFDEKLLKSLTDAMNKLDQLGASKIVVTCLTSHYFFPRLSFQIRGKIISLVDLILQEIHISKRPTLLLCTNGAYLGGLFKAHSDWSTAEPYIVIPTDKDRGQIHNLIYEIKKTGVNESTLITLKGLLGQYHVDSCLAGCTEFHLVKKYLRQMGDKYDFDMIDPLHTLAMNLNDYL
jgi:aspartate racemase